MKKLFLITIVIIFNLISICYALETDTHKTINEYIAQNTLNGFSLNSCLQTQIGIQKGVDEIINSKKIFNWIGEGGVKEDKPYWWMPYLRSVNHFHNPLTDQGFNGIWGYDFLYGQSSINWSQTSIGNQYPGGHYSWYDVRDYFYKALTLTNKTDRETNFTETFRGIGQLMHLVEDMSVPEHTRDDGHYIFYNYEKWVLSEIPNTNAIALYAPFIFFDPSSLGNPNPLAPVPVANLFDTDQYVGPNPDPNVTLQNNVGLSEYTNANFLSPDSYFTPDFPYPDWGSVVEYDETISGKKKTYLRKLGQGETESGKVGNGEHIEHLALTGWLYKWLPGDLKKNALRPVYSDYAQKLISRAVGYSAGLLNYFFRGNIEITLPATGIYAKTTNPAVGFTSIKLLAKNITSNGDEMTDGRIKLVVKYKLASEDPFHSIPVPTAQDFSYIIVPENTVRSIPKTTTVELNFDLTQNPIPLYAVDLYLQVVYKGTLGNETDAVAVGYKDISEPTPIDIFSNTDWICLYNNWYVAGSPEAIAQVDVNQDGIAYGANEYDVYPHDQKNIYVKVSSVSNPQAASSSNYDVKETYLTRGNLATPLYILSDDYQSTTYQFVYSLYSSWVKIDPNDYWTHANRLHTYYGSTIKNQTEYAEDSEFCGGNFPCRVYPGYDEYYFGFYPLRGVDMWWGGGLIYIISPYPSGSECDYGLL